MNQWLAGPVAGFAATAPMTLLMETWYRRLPREEQYTLPPFEIMMNAAEKLGVLKHLDEEQKRWAVALAGHFGYGTASGLVYILTFGKAPVPSVIKGALFGAGLWTISYLPLMPALGLLSPATRHPAQRNALMFTANVLWGIVAGVLVEQLQEQRPQPT